MPFEKENLLDTYQWLDEPASTRFRGVVTRRKFDRNSGDQMLLVINAYAVLCENFSVAEGQMIEKYIHNRLPMEAISELTVVDWLINSFEQNTN